MNHYETLGIRENASQEEIRAAYRTLALQWHPDRFATASEEERLNAEKVFKRINEAHRVLSDPVSRYEYDCTLHPFTFDFGGPAPEPDPYPEPTPPHRAAASQHRNGPGRTASERNLPNWAAWLIAVPVTLLINLSIGNYDSGNEKGSASSTVHAPSAISYLNTDSGTSQFRASSLGGTNPLATRQNPLAGTFSGNLTVPEITVPTVDLSKLPPGTAAEPYVTGGPKRTVKLDPVSHTYRTRHLEFTPLWVKFWDDHTTVRWKCSNLTDTPYAVPLDGLTLLAWPEHGYGWTCHPEAFVGVSGRRYVMDPYASATFDVTYAPCWDARRMRFAMADVGTSFSCE